MRYSDWPEEKIEISKLQLDPFNPRLPQERSSLSQPEIRKELVENYEVDVIASMIAFYSYFPMEALIAFKEGENIFVLEGNRRLSACQLLLNPKLAPFGYEAKFTALSKQMKDKYDIKKVKVVFAPDRDSAIPILLAKHTRNAVQDWVPSMKNKFYVDLLERFTESELDERFGIKPSELNKSLVVDDLYNIAKRFDYDNGLNEIVNDSKKFPVSTLARVFTNTAGKEYFKSSIVDGRVNIVSNPKDFFPAFKELVTRLAEKSLNSRKLNNAKLIAKELKDFREVGISEPKTALDTPLALEDAYKQYSKVEKKSVSKKVAKKKIVKKVKSKALIPIDFECNTTNDRLSEVCEELKQIEIAHNPNAVSVLLRLFLELATYNFLYDSGELKKMETKAKGTGTKAPPTFPELRKMLDWIVTRDLLGNPQVTNSLKLFITSDTDKPILAQLNQFVHNFAYHPEEKELRHIWKSLSEYFKIVIK